MNSTPLRDRLLFLEARVAMLEDRLGYYQAQARLVVKSLIGWAELLAFYAAVRLFLRYAPDIERALKIKEKK